MSGGVSVMMGCVSMSGGVSVMMGGVSMSGGVSVMMGGGGVGVMMGCVGGSEFHINLLELIKKISLLVEKVRSSKDFVKLLSEFLYSKNVFESFFNFGVCGNSTEGDE